MCLTLLTLEGNVVVPAFAGIQRGEGYPPAQALRHAQDERKNGARSFPPRPFVVSLSNHTSGGAPLSHCPVKPPLPPRARWTRCAGWYMDECDGTSKPRPSSSSPMVRSCIFGELYRILAAQIGEFAYGMQTHINGLRVGILPSPLRKRGRSRTSQNGKSLSGTGCVAFGLGIRRW